MADVASIDTRAISRRAIQECRHIRRAVLAAIIGALPFFASMAHAGNNPVSSTLPASMDSNAVANVEVTQRQPVIRRGREPSEPKLLRAAAIQSDQEFAPQPNTIRAKMALVSPAAAHTHDAEVGKDLPSGINANNTIETGAKLNLEHRQKRSGDVLLQNFSEPTKGLLRSSGVTAANGIVTNDAPPGPASIEELARALRYDVDLIYQYVHNNIEIDPVRGIHKGALGAVLDNYGSAWDQSQLMVSLLRASGYEARFVRGNIKLSAKQFSDWYGLPVTNACAVLQLMGETQIPAVVSSLDGSDCKGVSGPMTEISMEHLWVKVKIDGAWYTFDPSYKPHTMKSGIDLNMAARYNAASFFDGYTGKGWTPSDGSENPYIGTPDVAGIVNQLSMTTGGINVLATNLAVWISANKPNATLSDIIGGKSIIPFFGKALREEKNPRLDTSRSIDEWADIPDIFKPTVRVRYQGMDQTFTSDAIYGKRLTITYNASNQPTLKLDGRTIGAPGSPVAPGVDSVVRFVVWHNAYAGSDTSDHAFDQHIKGGGTYLIVNGWGRTGRGLSQFYSKSLEDARAAGNSDDSEAVLGASLGVLGAQWLSQTNKSASITERLANTYTVQQHQVGIAGFYRGAYVDLPSNVLSVTQMDGNTTLENAVFESDVMHMSMLESTTVDQVSGVPAVSTVSLLAMASRKGVRLYDTGGGNYATIIKPQLRGCEAYLRDFQDYLDHGYRLLIPRDCKMTSGSWSGTGYFILSKDALGAVISGGFSGGFPIEPSSASAYNGNASNAKSPREQNFFNGAANLTNDPIDLVHGNFLYEHQDIKTGYGNELDSLSFQRLYSSGMKNQSGPLGKGWTHAYDIRLRTGSDGFLGLGDRLAVDAVAAIIEHKVSLDVLDTPYRSAQRYLFAVVAQNWLGELLIDNTRTVTFGLNSDVFVRMPDLRSFIAPPGKAVNLVVTGETAKYTTLGGGYYSFKVDKVSSYVHPNGQQIGFTWSGDLLTRVDNSVGRSLTFAYANSRLQKISSPQQTVFYTYDDQDNLVAEIDPDSYTTRFEYDQPGRMTKFYQPSFFRTYRS
jgi:YD repeat-containing protein